MAALPSSPAGFPGWQELTAFEAQVWGYLMLPGKRSLAAFAKAIGSTKQTAQDAKTRAAKRLRAAAKAQGTDFDTMLAAYRGGQKAMRDAPSQPPRSA